MVNAKEKHIVAVMTTATTTSKMATIQESDESILCVWKCFHFVSFWLKIVVTQSDWVD